MHFPVVIHKDSNSDYGVTVPDLPGCFSAGDTLDEALENTKEAIECHLEGLLLDGEKFSVSATPSPKSIERYYKNTDYADGFWALVTIDFSKISGKSKPINLTLPEILLSQIDKYVKNHGDTRSSLLAQAAIEYMSTHN